MEEPTARAFLWKVLEQEFAPRMEPAAWTDLLRRTGAPAYAEMPPEAPVPLEPVRRALADLDLAWGPGDGAVFEAAGHAVAKAWGHYFTNLLPEFQDRPDRLYRLLVDEIHPHLLAAPGGAQLVEAGPRRATVRFRDGLPPSYHAGLLTGLAALCGTHPHLQPHPGGAWTVSWKPASAADRPRPLALALALARPPLLAATLLPFLVALAIAAQEGSLHAGWALMTILGIALFQFGTNAINDYYDHRAGHDAADAPPSSLGGGRALRHGLLEPRHLKTFAYAFYAAGTLIGLVLTAVHGIEILWLGLAGFLLGVLYSTPPVRLVHRGLGELAVAIGFGPLILIGTYFVQRGAWSLEALLASLPLAFLIAAVLYVHELPDPRGDARVGKRTLFVRLPERPAVIVYLLVSALAYVAILAGVALRSVPTHAAYAFPPWSLLGLATLPLSLKVGAMLMRDYRFPHRLAWLPRATIGLHLATGLLFGSGYFISLLA